MARRGAAEAMTAADSGRRRRAGTVDMGIGAAAAEEEEAIDTSPRRGTQTVWGVAVRRADRITITTTTTTAAPTSGRRRDAEEAPPIVRHAS